MFYVIFLNMFGGSALANPYTPFQSFTTVRAVPQLQPGTTTLMNADGDEIGIVHTEMNARSTPLRALERWVITTPGGYDDLADGYIFEYVGPSTWHDARTSSWHGASSWHATSAT